jgi:hypothetical protein
MMIGRGFDPHDFQAGDYVRLFGEFKVYMVSLVIAGKDKAILALHDGRQVSSADVAELFAEVKP